MSPRAFDRVMVAMHIASHAKFADLTNDELLCFITGILPICQQSPFRGTLIVGDNHASVDHIRAQAGRRITARVVTSTLEKLREVGVIYDDAEVGAPRVHDFEQWNPAPKIDRTNATRQARYRARRNAVTEGERNGASNGVSNAVVTPTKKEEKKNIPHIPLRGNTADFEEWLLHHEQTTGHTAPRTGTKARAAIVEAFGARQAEGYPLADLKLATVGAHEDEYRRTNGYDTAESVLRPTKVAALIARGRLRGGGGPRRTDVAAQLDRAYGRTAR